MDRRVVAGLVSLLVVGGAEVGSAQTGRGRDPSAQPSVGLSTIPSIADTINNSTLGSVPPAFANVPTSPVGNGPAASIPRPPVLTSPVSLTPIEPIDQSINQGFGTRGIFSRFRKPVPRAVTPPGPPPTMRPRATVAPKLDPVMAPANWTPPPPEDPSQSPTTVRTAPNPLDRLPELPRPPSAARLGAEPSNPPSTGPSVSVAELPAPPVLVPIPVEPAPAVTPVELPPAPVLEPLPLPTTSAASPPDGSDPLQGVELVAAAKPPTTTPADPTPTVPTLPTLPDPDVKRTSQDPVQDETAVRLKPARPKPLPYATLRAAAVGDQIITINELETAVNDEIRERMAGHEGPMSQEEAQQLKQLKNMVASSVLERLINQSLVISEAKHKMQKNDKAKQQFEETLDKIWKTDEVPPLLRKYGCTNVYELKAKLASQGRSYEAMKEVFRKKILFNEFLRAEIRHKLTCDLAEQRAYYNEHLSEFEQPARMTWREIEVSFAKNPNRAAARKKAEDALARLLHDENFETVARTMSDGPTASKGGVYVDMQPGSYGIPVVNDELNRISIGQVSQILEAPGSFHIVRVDSRREKGPLRFDEVQDKIKDKVFEQNFRVAVDTYLAKLRARTLIRTMFDKTESDPSIARRTDPAVRQASGPR